MSRPRTMGEAHPHLVVSHPELAARPFPWPPAVPTFTPIRTDPQGKIRVGLACQALYSAGAEAWQLALVRSVDPDRISWRGLVVHDGHAIDPQMQSRFEALMPVGSGRDSIPKLAAECDILISWAVEDLQALLAKLALPPKTVEVCHAPPESTWGQALYTRANPDRFVAVSELALQAIPADRRAQARVIWNGVDESRLGQSRTRAEMHRAWGVPDGCKVAGFYQRMAEEKDPFAALRLARSLPSDWRVVFVGGGWMRDQLVASATADELRNLIFAGQDNDAGSVLRAFDCLVCSSDFESFCLSMAEAIWVGTPVVSTDVGLAKIARSIAVPESSVSVLTVPIPMRADGPTLAAAVLSSVSGGSFEDHYSRRVREITARAIRPRLAMKRFGDEWTEFLCGLTRPKAVKLALVNECPDRGSTLHRDPDAGCCGGGPELNGCRLGKGARPGAVTLRECIACRDF